MRLAPLLAVLMLGSGCAVHLRGPHPGPLPLPAPRPAPQPRPPPPAPPPAPPSRPASMGYDEAVSLGRSFCQSRGYDCQLKEAHPAEGGDRWKVKFRAFAPSARGHLHLEYNAYSRALLKVDEKVKARKNKGKGHGRGKHGKGDDDDWEDDD